MLFPISLLIDFNERENRNPIAIPFPPRRKTRHLRVAHREDNPKDRGVEEGKRISKLLGRTFSDACALSLPALPLSQIAINRQATRRRRNVPLSNVVAIQIEGVPKVALQGSREFVCYVSRFHRHALFAQCFASLARVVRRFKVNLKIGFVPWHVFSSLERRNIY